MASCALYSPLAQLSEETPNQCGLCFIAAGPALSTFLVITETFLFKMSSLKTC